MYVVIFLIMKLLTSESNNQLQDCFTVYQPVSYLKHDCYHHINYILLILFIL